MENKYLTSGELHKRNVGHLPNPQTLLEEIMADIAPIVNPSRDAIYDIGKRATELSSAGSGYTDYAGDAD